MLKEEIFAELEQLAKSLEEQKQLELQLRKQIALSERKIELLRKLIEAETDEAA